MLVDAVMLAAVFVGTTALRQPLVRAVEAIGVPARIAFGALVLLSLGVALPFGVGLVTSARRLAARLAELALPTCHGVDQAHAPRGVLTTVLLIALVLVVAVPMLALTAPFLSAWPIVLVAGGLLLLLAISFWRSARNLDTHAHAGAELIVDVIARQGRDKDEHHVEMLQEMLPGLGSIVPFTVEAGSAAVGQSLSDLNLRGMTGVTVVALVRGTHRIVFPKADEVLQEGDVLALTGSHEAIGTAHRMLLGIEHNIAALGG
jgi:CPA2 family monovalent cation:H+ antiporter-2